MRARPGGWTDGLTRPMSIPSSGLPDSRMPGAPRSRTRLHDRLEHPPGGATDATGEDEVEPDVAGLREQRHERPQR